MIKVTIYRKRRLEKGFEYVGFDVVGHAGYSEAGEDIVCAAVSVLVTNCVNSVERLTQDRVDLFTDEVEGRVEFRFREKPTYEATLLLDSMVLGLEDIEDSAEYESYVDIIFEEV